MLNFLISNKGVGPKGVISDIDKLDCGDVIHFKAYPNNFHNKDHGKNKMEYLGDETAAGEKISELREALDSFLEKYGKIPF